MKTMEVTEKTSLKDLVILAKQESGVVLTDGQKPVVKVVPIVGDVALPGVPQPRPAQLRNLKQAAHCFSELPGEVRNRDAPDQVCDSGHNRVEDVLNQIDADESG